MKPRIVSIGTAVPSTPVSQTVVRDFFVDQQGTDRLTRRLIHAAFDAAQIEQRHTVLTQLADPAAGLPGAGGIDFVGEDSTLLVPSTGARNAVYERVAPSLYAEAARSALTQADLEPDAVTHVVTVSCTGFFAPGPDYRLVRDLGLSPLVERYHLGFIGCAAAMPALRLAARLVAAQPGAVVLVACAELCSLHIRASSDPQQIVAASVFADGAAAAIVTDDASIREGRGLELDRFSTALTTSGEKDMAWTIGDEGFLMTLSAEVPRIIGREVRAVVADFLGGQKAPDAWAVHPGGRSVLDRVEAGLDLPAQAMERSRAVLRDYGNMSSATILFILRAILNDDDVADDASVGALAFGPGLTVESALLVKRGPQTP